LYENGMKLCQEF